jgi:serine/threonine protein kinase
MKVIFQGQTIELDASKMLGGGGEANILKYGKLAFKIYHDPTAERAAKLVEFLARKFGLPQNVMAPLDTITNTRGKVVGFAMSVAEKCKDLINVFDTGYRRQRQIDSNDVLKMFLDIRTTVQLIHDNKLVIGDFNDLNLLFGDTLNVVFIDVDSYQFDKYPCIVGTDSYIDPVLYGVDLSKKPYFTKETDSYSFAVMLFRALYFVHPYGGVHKKFKTLFSRAQNKVWAFEKDVVYPKIGLHPETVDDSLLSYFSRVFCKGERVDLPVQTLQMMQGSFVECKTCGAQFSRTRSKCPQCQKAPPIQAIDLSSILVKKQIGSEKCEATCLFETTGIILFAKVVDTEIVIVSFDGKQTVCSTIRSDGYKHEVVLWQGLSKHFSYDYFQPHCLVVADGEDLMLFRVDSDKLKPITKTSTTLFASGSAFSCSNNKLYRLTSTMMMSASLLSNEQLLEQNVTAAMADQTWMDVGQNGFGLGLYRVFRDYMFFVFSSKGKYDVNLKQLEGQLIDLDVRVSVKTLLLLRKNLHHGRTYSHWHIISDEGEVLETKSEESISSDLLKNIHGKELVGSSIVHSTDAGVTIEKHGDISLKVSTAEFVTSDSKLLMYKQGILAISGRRIMYLHLV